MNYIFQDFEVTKSYTCRLGKRDDLIKMEEYKTWAVKTFNPESMFVINDSTVSGGFAPHLQHV